MEPKAHQSRGVGCVIDRFLDGDRRLCLTSPTGGGKTLMMEMVVEHFVKLGLKVVLYTNRRNLIQQLDSDMTDARVAHGVRAAGYESELGEPFQISSIQSEVSRTLKRGSWWLHAAGPGDLAIFDEGHLHTTGKALELRRMHLAGGAHTLDVTATPLGMGEVCDDLVVAGTNTELRDCGMLLMVDHYAPDEPDWRELRSSKRRRDNDQDDGLGGDSGEDLSENKQRKLMGSVDASGRPDKAIASLHGRVWKHFERLNPDRKPTLLFAPGVRESVWLAQQFELKGVPAASIDATEIWRGGESLPKTDERWEELLDDWKTGKITVVCNRFVLREGVNAPWIGHGIMATALGSALSYIQSGGRLLRSYPGLENVTLQDHGGNFWRHGSLNVDRSWTLDDTSRSIFNRRADAIREKRERAPVVCPECGRALTRKVCPCGHVVSAAKLPRAVFTTDGQLTAMAADYFPVHKRTSNPDLIASWITVWRRACTVKWYATWLQAEAFFAREVTQGFYPDRNWPLMPIDRDRDIGRKVLETPVDRLRGSPETLAKYRHWQENQLAKLEQSNGESIPQRNGEDQEEAPPEEPAGDGAAEERED